MTILIAGSVAWNAQVPDKYKMPEPKDIDVILDKGPIDVYNVEGWDVETFSVLNNRKIKQYHFFNPHIDIPTPWGNGHPILPVILAKIRRSHLHRAHNHQKNMGQYAFKMLPYLTEHHGGMYAGSFYGVSEMLRDSWFTDERFRLTKVEYPQGNPNLNQSNEGFFDDPVEKHYDHDWLHEMFAYGDVPVYTKLKRDDTKAWCAKDLWDQLPFDEKVDCVLEESMVIASERFIIPRIKSNNPAFSFSIPAAFHMSLAKVCTTLCSGWFRDFAIDAYRDIIATYDSDYHRDKLDEVLQHLNPKLYKGE